MELCTCVSLLLDEKRCYQNYFNYLLFTVNLLVYICLLDCLIKFTHVQSCVAVLFKLLCLFKLPFKLPCFSLFIFFLSTAGKTSSHSLTKICFSRYCSLIGEDNKIIFILRLIICSLPMVIEGYPFGLSFSKHFVLIGFPFCF